MFPQIKYVQVLNTATTTAGVLKLLTAWPSQHINTINVIHRKLLYFENPFCPTCGYKTQLCASNGKGKGKELEYSK